MGKKIKYHLLIVEVLLSLGIIISACSELDTSLPTVTELSIHKSGILDHGSPNFHGNLLRDSGWDFVVCKNCHASDYSGGITGSSCFTCHTQPEGPEACNTCHGDFDDPNIIAPPEDTNHNISTESVGVGAHIHHLYHNELGADIECSTCHRIPQNYTDPGHVDSPLPAEIILSNLAIINLAGSANYDHSIATCSEVYCHGNWEFFKDSTANPNKFAYTSDRMTGNNLSMIWNKVDGSQALCGSCHNLPPEGHIAADITICGICHAGVVDVDGNIIDKSKHINGRINVFGN